MRAISSSHLSLDRKSLQKIFRPKEPEYFDAEEHYNEQRDDEQRNDEQLRNDVVPRARPKGPLLSSPRPTGDHDQQTGAPVAGPPPHHEDVSKAAERGFRSDEEDNYDEYDGGRISSGDLPPPPIFPVYKPKEEKKEMTASAKPFVPGQALEVQVALEVASSPTEEQRWIVPPHMVEATGPGGPQGQWIQNPHSGQWVWTGPSPWAGTDFLQFLYRYYPRGGSFRGSRRADKEFFSDK